MLAFALGFASAILLSPVPIVVIIAKRSFQTGIAFDA